MPLRLLEGWQGYLMTGQEGLSVCAHASAVVYSLGGNGHGPYTWLKHALERLPLAKTVEDIETLLPWNVDTQQVAMGLAA